MIIISPGFQSLIKTNLFFLLKKVILKLQEINIEKCKSKLKQQKLHLLQLLAQKIIVKIIALKKLNDLSSLIL